MKKGKPKNKMDMKKAVIAVLVIAALAIFALSATAPPKSAENASNNCDSVACPINAEETGSTSTILSGSTTTPETTLAVDDRTPMEQSLDKINEDLQKARLTQTTVSTAARTVGTMPSVQETNPISTTDKTATIKSDLSVKAVEDVIAGPEAFVGSSMGVKGTVVNTYPSKQQFTMGCSCRQMPVEYTGVMPVVGSTIIVYGKVIKQDASGYVFKADSIQ